MLLFFFNALSSSVFSVSSLLSFWTKLKTHLFLTQHSSASDFSDSLDLNLASLMDYGFDCEFM